MIGLDAGAAKLGRRGGPFAQSPARGASPSATLCALAVFASGAATAAPITTNTALPISEDEAIVRFQIAATRASDTVGGVEREANTTEARAVLGYGLTPKLAVFVVAPVVHLDAHIGAAEINEFGLGDAELITRYELIRRDGLGRTFRLAPFVGLRLPTGDSGETGDGSLDIFGGLIATFATVDWQIDAEIGADANREADGFDRGDAAHLNVSLQRRLGSIGPRGGEVVYGVFETSVMYVGEDRVASAEDPDSGGALVFVAPGLQIASRRWIADLAVRAPVSTNMNGTALAPDITVFASVRVNY